MSVKVDENKSHLRNASLDCNVHRRHPIDGRAYMLAPPGDGNDVAVVTVLGPTTSPTRGRQRLVLVPTEVDGSSNVCCVVETRFGTCCGTTTR